MLFFCSCNLFQLFLSGIPDFHMYFNFTCIAAGWEEKSWRVQVVSLAPDRIDSHKALPEKWRRMRDDELSKETSIPASLAVYLFVWVASLVGTKPTRERWKWQEFPSNANSSEAPSSETVSWLSCKKSELHLHQFYHWLVSIWVCIFWGVKHPHSRDWYLYETEQEELDLIKDVETH